MIAKLPPPPHTHTHNPPPIPITIPNRTISPLIYVTLNNRIEWFEKNYLSGKAHVVDFLKLAMVYSMIISGACHAFHTTADKEWCHNFVTIATRVFKLAPQTPHLWIYYATKFWPVKRYITTQLWRHSLSAMVWNAHHAPEIIMLHTKVYFKM